VPEVVGRQVFTAEDRFSPYYQYSDTPSGTYWCAAFVDQSREHDFAITLGVPYEHSRWFRGRGDRHPPHLGVPGRGMLPAPARAARRALGRPGLAVGAGAPRTSCPRCPRAAFPVVDEADVFAFLERHEKE